MPPRKPTPIWIIKSTGGHMVAAFMTESKLREWCGKFCRLPSSRLGEVYMAEDDGEEPKFAGFVMQFGEEEKT